MRPILILLAIAQFAFADAPLAPALFQTTVEQGKNKTVQTWTFERKTNQVFQTRHDRIEIWTKTGPREIALEQVYRAEKLIIEFNQGELNAAGHTNGWNAFNQLVNTNLFARLGQQSPKRVLGHNALRFKGEVDGAEWVIHWIPDLSLPALIERKDKSGRMRTELKKLNTTPEVLNLSGFERLDYADLGDMEYHPGVKKLLSKGAIHAHRH
ncbi:MAG: hypothetical protein SFY81_02695 [Verrucomicrobiota bacterium]|nr:hypothetical protein [Verrucomicrobiota bacterium]